MANDEARNISTSLIIPYTCLYYSVVISNKHQPANEATTRRRGLGHEATTRASNELARRNPPDPKAAYRVEVAPPHVQQRRKTVRDLLKRQEDLVRTAFTDQLTGLLATAAALPFLEEHLDGRPVTWRTSISRTSQALRRQYLAITRATAIFCRVSLCCSSCMRNENREHSETMSSILSTIATEDDLGETSGTLERSCSKTTMPRCLTRLATEWHTRPPWAKPNRLTNDADHTACTTTSYVMHAGHGYEHNIARHRRLR